MPLLYITYITPLIIPQVKSSMFIFNFVPKLLTLIVKHHLHLWQVSLIIRCLCYYQTLSLLISLSKSFLAHLIHHLSIGYQCVLHFQKQLALLYKDIDINLMTNMFKSYCLVDQNNILTTSLLWLIQITCEDLNMLIQWLINLLTVIYNLTWIKIWYGSNHQLKQC